MLASPRTMPAAASPASPGFARVSLRVSPCLVLTRAHRELTYAIFVALN